LCAGTAVSGMPADCVKVGLARLVPAPVDLVLSGINAGCNVGVHTLYSGTVAAAREAAIAGVAAVSVSLHIGRWDAIRWDRASELAASCLERIVAEPLPPGTYLNVNIPILDGGAEPRGIRVVPVSSGAMVDEYQGDPDESGRVELTVGRLVRFHEMPPGTDAELLFQGYLTISPMRFEPTDRDALDGFRERLG
jgi:5'-nucleotidase